MRFWRAGWASVLALGLGCTEPAATSGNAALGIAAFQVSDTAEETTIIAVDAEKKPVGRIDLVHGRFVPSRHGVEQVGQEAVGRKLTVELRGRTTRWETHDFSDTMHMPALRTAELAALVADPHVRPLLERWRIGWDAAGEPPPSRGPGEVAYTSYSVGSCGNTNTCPGDTTWDSAFSGNTVYQCCGSGTSGEYSTKACSCTTQCSGGSNNGGSCTSNSNCPGGACGYATACGNSGSLNQKCVPCFKEYYGNNAIACDAYGGPTFCISCDGPCCGSSPSCCGPIDALYCC
jgi:hypothetical protein